MKILSKIPTDVINIIINYYYVRSDWMEFILNFWGNLDRIYIFQPNDKKYSQIPIKCTSLSSLYMSLKYLLPTLPKDTLYDLHNMKLYRFSLSL